MIDFDDMEEDPLAQQRADLARIIIDAQRWGRAARWLFVVGLVATVFGVGLIVAGTLGVLGECAR